MSKASYRCTKFYREKIYPWSTRPARVLAVGCPDSLLAISSDGQPIFTAVEAIDMTAGRLKNVRPCGTIVITDNTVTASRLYYSPEALTMDGDLFEAIEVIEDAVFV